MGGYGTRKAPATTTTAEIGGHIFDIGVKGPSLKMKRGSAERHCSTTFRAFSLSIFFHFITIPFIYSFESGT